MTGWVKTHRNIIEWEWYKVPYMAHLFGHLILKANHKDGKWRGYNVMRGQLITGRTQLSVETGIPEQSVRTCLNRLKKTKEIEIKSTSKFSLITICNYGLYQGEDDATNQQTNQVLTSNQPGANQVLTTNKNVRREEGKNTKQGTVFNPIEIKPQWINASDWEDLVLHRKKKKATETKRAYSGLINQIEKAKSKGYTPSEVIDTMCQRNWTGINADWLDAKPTNGAQSEWI